MITTRERRSRARAAALEAGPPCPVCGGATWAPLASSGVLAHPTCLDLETGRPMAPGGS